MEAVPDGNSEGDGAKYREDDQEERADGVYHEGCRLEHEFQQLPEKRLHRPLHVVHRPVYVHTARFYGVQHAEFLQPFVELLLVHQIGRLGIALHRLVFEPVFLLPVLVHVECLGLQDVVRPLDDGRQHVVDGAQHDTGKKHDAESQHERSEQGIHVDGFRPRKGLPHPVRDIEQRAQSGDAFRHSRHLGAERHHVLVQTPQNPVQVLKIYCQ